MQDNLDPKIENFITRNRLYSDEEFIVRKRTRANGEGSIRKRAGGNFEGRYTVGFKNGKQIIKSVYSATRKECNEKLQNSLIKNKEQNAAVSLEKTPSLSDWLYVWLNEYRKDLNASARKRYIAFIKKLDEKTSKQKLTELLPLELQKYINTFSSFEMAKRAISMLQNSLSDALNNGFIARNPAAGLRNPLTSPSAKFEPNKKAFSIDEEKAFVQAIDNSPYRFIYLICLYAGLRRGEATALTWDKIDLSSRLIHVTEAAKRGEGKGYSVGKTKTSTSVRTVPISQKLFNILSAEQSKKGYLYPLVKMLNADVLSMNFKNIMSQLGQKHTLHHLRHTFATRCMEKGIKAKVVQTWMGHSSTDMTLNTYTHATDDLIASEKQKLDDVF